jgi:hypothetical protein
MPSQLWKLYVSDVTWKFNLYQPYKGILPTEVLCDILSTPKTEGYGGQNMYAVLNKNAYKVMTVEPLENKLF